MGYIKEPEGVDFVINGKPLTDKQKKISEFIKAGKKRISEIKTRQKARTANKVLPKAGFNCFYETFVQGSTAVILLNFCAKTPAFDNTRPLCHMLIIISM